MKNTLKKVLLIAWLAVCTAAFIYFSIVLIKHTSIAVEQLSYYEVPNAAEIFPGMDIERYVAEQTQGIEQNICLIVFIFVLYGSFVALTIPKIVSLFHKSAIENGIDIHTR